MVPHSFQNSYTATIKEDCLPHQALLDYYKCPKELAAIEFTGELSKEEGYFRFGPGIVCYGRCTRRRPLAQVIGPLFDTSSTVEIDHGVVRLPFDLSEIVSNLRRERYATRNDASRLSRIFAAAKHDVYYFFRPWLPIFLRKYLQRLDLSGWRSLRFPQWPVDYTVDTILERALILSMKANGISSVPFIWFWPEGAQSCAMMTHDVETSAGIAFCRELMALDESYAIKSSFQIVPEERYTGLHKLLEEFRSRGFELNVQDLNHDGNLFRDQAEFIRRAGRINQYLRQYGSRGFRSAIMYRNAEFWDPLRQLMTCRFPAWRISSRNAEAAAPLCLISLVRSLSCL